MKKFLVWACVILFGSKAIAHPMPSSVVHLSVLEDFIRGEAKIPLIELANAVGDARVARLHDPFFITYFTDHIQASSVGQKWSTRIDSITLLSDTDPVIGRYQEVVIHFTLTPPDARYLRTFTFHYDAVMHQVVTHSALVYVQQDWSNGIHTQEDGQQIGVIRLDIPSGKLFPLQVNLENGSWWKGFSSMLSLGMQHIREGTDHLLFLIVLLLPAMLLTDGKRWGGFGGVRFSVTRLLKIVTAFTIGHSITLILGALGWVHLPGQPIEILIAFSILVSAVHAMRPLFPGKEIFIAAGFGLIHGLAFAAVLANLQLSADRMALSILGFNLGIEIMQLFVIALIIPWLILLSKTPVYRWIRISAATFAGIAAIAWILQRTTGTSNFVTTFMEVITGYGRWGIAALAVVSLLVYIKTIGLHKKIN